MVALQGIRVEKKRSYIQGIKILIQRTRIQKKGERDRGKLTAPRAIGGTILSMSNVSCGEI